MKISDIRKHLSKVLHEKTELKVFSEDFNKIVRPCLYLKNINSSRESMGQSIERLKVSFDIEYFPSQANTSCNNEIQDALDTINGAFDNDAYKVLKVYDRTVILNNTSSNITDNVGHYLIDLAVNIEYGARENYDLMGTLELDTNIEN